MSGNIETYESCVLTFYNPNTDTMYFYVRGLNVPLVFSLKTAGQSYCGQIIVGRMAALPTVRVIGGLVLGHLAALGRGTWTGWRARWDTWVDHHTDSLRSSARELIISVENFGSEGTPGRKQRSAGCKRRVDWAPRSERHLVYWRENGGRWLEHSWRDDVTAIWPRFWSMGGCCGFIFDLTLSPSCATVLEPDLTRKRTTVNKCAVHFSQEWST